MDIATETGKNSKLEAYLYGRDMGEDVEEVIRYFLLRQPQSYEEFYTIDEYLQTIREGRLQALVFAENDKAIGLVVFAVVRVGKKIAIRGDFISCTPFFKLATFYDQFEAWAKKFGADYIDGYVHPTIAEYAAKKHGYSVGGVYLFKALTDHRRH